MERRGRLVNTSYYSIPTIILVGVRYY